MKSLGEVEKGLFFIVGCGRSGTTLLKTILHSHSQVFIPHETFFYTSVVSGVARQSPPLAEMLHVLCEKWWMKDMQVDSHSIELLFKDSEPTWENVFLALLSSLCGEQDAIAFGEKTPSHIRHAKELMEAFPNCRVIQVMRDPRAVFSSFISSSVGTNQIATFIHEWSFAAQTHQELLTSQRYTCIPFEQIITDTQRTIEGLCGFLNIPFETGMLKFYDREEAGFSPEQTHHQNTRKPIFTTGLNTWETKLSKIQIGMIDHYLGDSMEQFGYQRMSSFVSFPKQRLVLSSLLDKASKICLRKPRQIAKEYRARRRQKNG